MSLIPAPLRINGSGLKHLPPGGIFDLLVFMVLVALTPLASDRDFGTLPLCLDCCAAIVIAILVINATRPLLASG